MVRSPWREKQKEGRGGAKHLIFLRWLHYIIFMLTGGKEFELTEKAKVNVK